MSYKFSSQKLCNKFESFRKSRKLTYRELEAESGVPFSTINRLLAKGDIPSIKHLLMLCNALGVSPRSLFEIEK